MIRRLNDDQIQLLAESVAQLGLALLVLTVLPLFTSEPNTTALPAIRGFGLATLAYITSLVLLAHDDRD